MSYNTAQRAFFDSASTQYIQANNLGSIKQDWSYGDKQAYNRYMANVIATAPDGLFDREDRVTAEAVKRQIGGGLEDASLFSQWGTLADELLRQHNRLNPFSEDNAPSTKIFLGLLAVGFSAILVHRFSPKKVRG